jgi:hypothetical protein
MLEFSKREKAHLGQNALPYITVYGKFAPKYM